MEIAVVIVDSESVYYWILVIRFKMRTRKGDEVESCR